MKFILVSMAQYIKIANCVVIEGIVEGSFKQGDILTDEDSKEQKFVVKGFTFIKRRGDLKSSIDIQLQPGNYSPESLVGKKLIEFSE